MDPPFAMRVTGDGRLAVSGDLDLGSAGILTDAIRSLLQSGARRVVLDLGGVSFIDSSGLAVLMTQREALEAAGAALVLSGLTARTESLLRVTGLDCIFLVEAPGPGW
jgi:anti-sigma B factor antagonist